MKTKAPNPTRQREPISFLLPFRIGRDIGTGKDTIVVATRPGQILKSREGHTRYEVQQNGSIKRLA